MHISSLSYENLVPISLNMNVEGIIIKEQFLWNTDTTDRFTLKQFGLQILSERLGRSVFSNLARDAKENFAETVAELIKYNIHLYNKLNMSRYIGTINNEIGNLFII